jgi:hypothetical protein
MKPVDKFNPGQWLVENKLTSQSKVDEIRVGNPNLSDDMKEYLSTMIEVFGDGNDNEYPVGQKMEFRYEGIDKADNDYYNGDQIEEFKNTRDFLEQKGPITFNHDKIDFTFSSDGEDIIMNWIEPDWEKLYGKL